MKLIVWGYTTSGQYFTVDIFLFLLSLYRCWSSVSSLLPLWRWCWTRAHLSLPVNGWTLCLMRYTRWALCSATNLFPSCSLFCLMLIVFVYFFLPCLRSIHVSSTWCVSAAVSLALCSISVAALYVCTWEPCATQQSVNWIFPALWRIICCCVMMGRSSELIFIFYTSTTGWCLWKH